MRWGWRWGSVLLMIGLLDFAVRFGTGWSMAGVVRAEAVLFLVASLGLLMDYRRQRANLLIGVLALIAGATVVWRRAQWRGT